jgi:hypothetical protein
MSDKKLLEDLKNSTDLRIRQFKYHDRLYWTSESGRMNIQGNLKCKVKDLEDEELKAFILENGVFLN